MSHRSLSADEGRHSNPSNGHPRKVLLNLRKANTFDIAYDDILELSLNLLYYPIYINLIPYVDVRSLVLR